MENIKNKPLEVCSLNPITGYNRDGYCRPMEGDYGSHLVCAKMDKDFLDFTASKNNNLRSVVKEGSNWCLCQDRYYEAYLENKQPKVIKNATYKNLKPHVKKAIMKKTKKRFLYNPNNPKKSFDVYIDKNPKDTIPIKYTSVDDVKNTIKKLERLYKNNKYTHKRIWQVGMILKVRLEAMLKHKKTMYSNAKNVKERFTLAKKYFLFLGSRTKEKEENRRKMIFKF